MRLRRPSRALVLLGLLGCDGDATRVAPGEAVEADARVQDAGDPPDAPRATEPPDHPFLADSVWSVSHRTPYAQGSSPLPGPVEAGTSRHLSVPGIPVTLNFSALYPDGRRAVWAAVVGSSGAILKLDHGTFEPIDVYVPSEREADAPTYALGISGAYSVLDVDQHLIVTRGRTLEVYGDARPGEAGSPIALLRRYALPDTFFCGREDTIVGITLLWTGELALATAAGVVGVLPRAPDALADEALLRFSINGDACDDDAVNTMAPEFQSVSNSIAADETGGIYVVTSRRMLRLRFDGSAVTLDWQAPYNAGAVESGIRLGAGSGSTPTLMGLPADRDRFVVITDGQDLMHLVLLWRDDIPADWQALSPAHDRRIACEVPVRFGDPDAQVSVSEQSVLVRGYMSIVVNNQIADESVLDGYSGAIRTIFSALESGRASQAPRGVERIDWDPATRTCKGVWANREVSVPNTIPTSSEASNLFYGVGLQGGLWGLHALDLDTGAARFFTPARVDSCDASFIDALGPVFAGVLRTWIEMLPQLCENTTFAATQVGPDGTVYTGTFFGVTRYD